MFDFLNNCILFTAQYNQNIHNAGQIHIIVHTDLTTEMWTDFESFLQQILFNKWNIPDIYACYLSVSASFHGFKKKKLSVVKELVLP